jgi:DNA-binding IclR family transcriptional regulator
MKRSAAVATNSGVSAPLAEAGSQGWTFLTNHAHVMVALAIDSHLRVRDLAAAIGITERAAQRIVGELVDAGYLVREKQGRRNRYELNLELALRHPLEGHHSIGELLAALAQVPATRPNAVPRAPI